MRGRLERPSAPKHPEHSVTWSENCKTYIGYLEVLHEQQQT